MLEDFTYQEFLGYLKGNVVKYERRAGLKAGTNDVAKAAQYRAWWYEFDKYRGITLNGHFYSKD